jgi:hypothetical protein
VTASVKGRVALFNSSTDTVRGLCPGMYFAYAIFALDWRGHFRNPFDSMRLPQASREWDTGEFPARFSGVIRMTES